jgi:hypothetical protein
MTTKSLLSRKVQLAFGSAILTLLVVGAISYRGMAVLILGTALGLLIAAAAGWSVKRDSSGASF